jgi:hypothetical protein
MQSALIYRLSVARAACMLRMYGACSDLAEWNSGAVRFIRGSAGSS